MESYPRTVTCSCGHTFETDRPKNWCDKCGRAVFADPKAQRAFRRSNFMMAVLLVAGIGITVYFFIEIVIKPFF